MRYVTGLIFWCLLLGSINLAQAQTAHKYWIFLEDKGASAGKTLSGNVVDLSSRTQERRKIRGVEYSRQLDAPVASGYTARLLEEGIQPIVQSRWLNAVSAYLDEAQLARVEAFSFVKSIQLVGRALKPESFSEPLGQGATPPSVWAPADTFNFGQSFAQLNQINAIPVLNRGINGTGVRLGFLDTIFNDFAHPAFERIRDEGRLIATNNFTDPQTNTHGLRVASTAVGFVDGELIGPAWGAEVLAATTEFAPSETNQEEDFLVAGLEWMEQEGVDVVNISLGYSTFDAGQHSYTTDDLDGDTGITTKAVDIAASLGVVVVTSAGNSGCDDPAFCWYYITMPADADSSITVGAVALNDQRASFSSSGPTVDGRIKPDVMALGVSAYMAAGDSSFAFGNGTSFSSPLVASVAAQILQANPELNPIQVRDILRQTASMNETPDNRMGWGIVNAEAAVEAAEFLATSTQDLASDLPQRIAISGSYPNPASSRLIFGLQLAEAIPTGMLSIYNVLGQQVATTPIGGLGEGTQMVPYDVSGLVPGAYFAVLEANEQTATQRFLVVR